MAFTVSDTTPRSQYTGNGVQTAFSVPFEFAANVDVAVAVDGAVKVLNTDFTLTGAAVSGGGTCTFTTAPANGAIVTIYRDMAIARTADQYSSYGLLPGQVLEADLDNATMRMQQLERDIALCVRAAITESFPPSTWQIPSVANRKGKYGYLFNPTTGAPELFSSIGAVALTNTLIGTTLDGLKQTAAELAAGVTPTNYGYPPGDVRRYGAVADGSTDSTTAIQNALTANAGAFRVVVPAGTSYYRLTGRVTAPANTTIDLQDGAELRWTATAATGSTLLGSATRPGIEVTGDNFGLYGRGVLRGPTAGSYLSNEIAIFAKGTSTSVRKSGFVVDGDIEILNWGAYGLAFQFVDRVRVFRARVHDIGLAGISALSCTNGRIKFNEVYNITPGGGADAYGITMSHDSTNYSSDPNIATPRLVANPFCIDFDVSHNTVYDIPVWRGIDFHGGYECKANFNAVYNCYYPIGMSASSGGAGAYAGENNQVNHNFITSKRRDGSASTVATLDGVAIVLNGGSTVRHINVECLGNTIDGYGLSSVESYSIECSKVRNAVIAGNRIRNWQRTAIYSTEGDGVMIDNIFDAVAAAATSRCVHLNGGTYGWTVKNNKHEPHGGTVAAEGMRIAGGTARAIVSDNNFAQATTPYIGTDGGSVRSHQTFAGEIWQRRTITYSASMTLDAQEGNEFDITATNGTAFTINAPTNPVDGQRITITIRNTSGGALGAVTWNAVFKLSTWTSPATGNNRSIDFRYDGTNWVQVSQTGVDVPN